MDAGAFKWAITRCVWEMVFQLMTLTSKNLLINIDYLSYLGDVRNIKSATNVQTSII